MISILIAAFGGGAMRGIVGFIKHQFSYKNVKFNPSYFIFMIALSGFVGLTTGWAIKESGLAFFGISEISPAIAFIIGYAGGDFIENVYKIIVKKTSLYPNAE